MDDAEHTRPEDTLKTELQNVTPGGRPARRRLATAEAAYRIFESYCTADEEDAKRRAIIQGMVDGNPPYQQAELDELGLGDMVNVNFLEMRANLDARAAAAHELFIEVPTLIECRPRKFNKNDVDGAEAFHYCSIVDEEFTHLLHDWSEFLPSMDLVVRESDAYGIGFGLWPDEWDWRIKAFRRGTLRFDAKASIRVDRNDVYMIRDEMTAGELFDIIEDQEAAAGKGWKVNNVRERLIQTFLIGDSGDQEDKYQLSTWESLQQMARNNDVIFEEKQFARVKIVHLLVREVSGDRGVSHYIIAEDESHQKFLMESFERFDGMEQSLWWLPYNYGDGYARSVRGVASLMVQHDDLSNRYLGRVFDAGFLSAGLILSPRGQMDLANLQFIHHGMYTILPPELQIQQSSFSPQITPLIQLRQVSENVMKNNTGTFRQHSENVVDREGQKTARQVIEETAKEARFEKEAVSFRYTQFDKLYREIFRRLTNPDYLKSESPLGGLEPAKGFMERCEDRGVPKKYIMDWKENFQVHATRALGLGSLGVKMDITNQLMMSRGDMDERGKRNVLRDWVAVRVGYVNVDKYVSKINRDQIPSNEHGIATLENNDMAEGSAIPVGTDQMHKIHVDVHFQAIGQLMQAFAGGQIQDPIAQAVQMQLLVEHVSQHVEHMRNEPTRSAYVKQVDAALKEAGGVLSQLQALAKRLQQQQQQMQEQQQQQQMQAQQVLADRELEAKIHEINRTKDLEVLKQNSLNEARADKTEDQMAIRRSESDHKLRLSAEKQAEELRHELIKLQGELDIKRRAAGA
jgi:hypothetical protein